MRGMFADWLGFVGVVGVVVGAGVAEAPAGYRAMWESAGVARRIDEGIERHRKGDAVLVVVDERGEPVRGVGVKIEQVTHEFLFGCNCFFLNGFKSAAKNARYEEAFAQLFNFASAPFYWSDLEPVQGKPRFPKDSAFVYRLSC